MAEKFDVKAFLQGFDIVQVIERYGHKVRLEKKGTEFVGLCPFHDDKNPSLKVSQRKQIFKCHVCGKGGSAIDYLQFSKPGMTFPEACDILRGGAGDFAPSNELIATQKRAKENPWTPVFPVPADAPTPTFNHYKLGRPVATWKYVDKHGSTLGHVCRFDVPGGKELLPYVVATDKFGKMAWRWLGFPYPRPLFNLHEIEQRQGVTVVVVEGEKCAEFLKSKVQNVVVTTWIGGSNSQAHADWSSMKGRNVILWPDNDAPGIDVMAGVEVAGEERKKGIVDFVREAGAIGVYYIHPPADAPLKWDCADATDWDNFRFVAFLRDSMKVTPPAYPVVENKPEEKKTEALIPNSPVPPSEKHLPAADPKLQPFQFLGIKKNEQGQRFVFFVYASKLVIELSSSSLSKTNLLTLAPLGWWEQKYPAKSGNFNQDAALDWLIEKSNLVGIFSETRLRGRGAWRESGTTVIHAGDRLISNGKSYMLGTVKTRYIYEAGEPLGIGVENPLTSKEAVKLMQVLKLINWERDVNAYLLAGWCIIAPVCGALKWRPHIWITGAAGTGKSWIFYNILRRLLGETVLAVQGETSEAGLRQLLGHDALPVVFDEAEGEDRKSGERMDSVLSLMRAASADDGGVMAKGTAGGQSKTYRIRSCFAFASIAMQIKQQSDRTRVSVLSVVRKRDADSANRWRDLQKLYSENITDDFVKRLQARTVSLLPIILRNAEVFSAAAAVVLGEQRIGDQLGALLAGAYSLNSNREVSYAEAEKFIREKNWNEERGLERTRDEVALFNYLMGHLTRLESIGSVVERSIGELCQLACGITSEPLIEPYHAVGRLGRLGVKCEQHDNKWYISISASARTIRDLLQNTAWANSHMRILLRLDGAMEVNTVRFAGVGQRAVRVPIQHLIG